MKILNAPACGGAVRSDKTACSPRTFRIEGRRVSYYPDDMALCLLDGGESPPVRQASPATVPDAGNTRIATMCLYLTRECNLACDYCFISQRRGSHEQHEPRQPLDLMSERTVCRALDVVAGNRFIRISFFGGEPMLAWNRLRWTVERAEALAKATKAKLSLSVTTNATLITSERATYLDQHGFSIVASIDGPAHLHDAHRRDAEGKGSYGRTLTGLGAMAVHKKLAARTTLRGTFRPGEAKLPERLAHAHELIDEYGFGGTSIEAASGCTSHCTTRHGYTGGEMFRAFMEGTYWCLDRARRGLRADWMYLRKSLQRLYNRAPSWNECGAAKGYCAVSPDGTIHSCHHEGYVIGHVMTGVDPERQEPWHDNRLTTQPQCARCWTRNVCGGGCRLDGYLETGKLSPAAMTCTVSRARTLCAMHVLAELRDEPDVLWRLMPKPKPRPKKCASG